MKDVNSITICRDNYSTREEWEDAIKKMVILLLENRQVMVVRYAEIGVIDIEFNPDRPDWGCHYPYWLSPEEEESIIYDEDREAVDE